MAPLQVLLCCAFTVAPGSKNSRRRPKIPAQSNSLPKSITWFGWINVSCIILKRNGSEIVLNHNQRLFSRSKLTLWFEVLTAASNNIATFSLPSETNMEEIQAVYAKVGSCHPLQRHIKTNSHIPRRAPAVLRPCRSESDFSRPRHSTAGGRHGHGMAWHGMCQRGPSRDARLLPAATHSRTITLLPFGMCLCWWRWRQQLYVIWTNLKVKASLSFVVMLRLHCVFFSSGKTSPLCCNYT